MAKRFTETNLNREPWFRKLTPKLKCSIRFLFDECDVAGIWVVDMETLSYFVGEEVALDELMQAVNADKKNRIEFLGTTKIFIPGFIDFQYGQLSEHCKPHQKIISILKKYNLKGYPKGIQRVQEKETEEEQEKEKEFGKSENLLKNEPENFEPAPGTLIGDMQGAWKESYPEAFIDGADAEKLLQIAQKIGVQFQIKKSRLLETGNPEKIKLRWGEILQHCRNDTHLSKYSITQIEKHFSSVIQSFNSKKNGTAFTGTSKNRKDSGAHKLVADLKSDIQSGA